MKLSSESKLFLAIGLVTGLSVFVAALIFSQPGKPLPKSDLILPTSYTRGNKDAPVWLVEFSDFQCPACQLFSGAVDQLSKKYPDQLFVAYRYFPLDQHPESRFAAVAAQAAGLQRKFWEMERLLFDNQASLSALLYRDLGKQLSLDMDAFEKSMSDPATAEIIEQDRRYGEKIGIQATPTFYLNGVKLELTSVEDLITKVEKAIQK